MRKYPHYIKGEKKATKYAEHGLIFVLLFCFRWYIHRKEYGRRNTKMFSSVQLLIRVWLFVTPWTVACQASLSITNSQSLLKSCPLSQWCHRTISSSVVSFSSCFQSFPASGSFPKRQFFASGSQSIGVSSSASILPINTQDWFPLDGLAGSPCNPRDSQESSPAPQFKSINSSVLSFLHSPTLTSIHDQWKNHSLD